MFYSIFSFLSRFFISSLPLQLDDLDEGQEGDIPKEKPNKVKEKERPFSVETKYKGYEELLDADEDDPDIVIPRDVQGSVRALKYALTHPLIFSEPHGTCKERTVPKSKVSFCVFAWMVVKSRIHNPYVNIRREAP